MAEQGKVARAIGKEEILEHCVYAMVNEGAKILGEEIAIRASDIDVVWASGYGWLVYRGGRTFDADTVGLATVVEKLKEHGERMGPGFTVSPLLEGIAAEARSFTG